MDGKVWQEKSAQALKDSKNCFSLQTSSNDNEFCTSILRNLPAALRIKTQLAAIEHGLLCFLQPSAALQFSN